MELLKPENKIRHQEVANFIPAVVEDQCAPFLVFSNAGIAMFIKMRAIGKGQSVTVLWKMAGDPVNDHADSFGMTAIHESPNSSGVP